MARVLSLLLAAAALLAMLAAAPRGTEASAAALRRLARRAPGFSQAGDDALLPTDAPETQSEKKPFALESDKEQKEIEENMNSRNLNAREAGVAEGAEARKQIEAEEDRVAGRPGQGKPCGKWDCSGKGLCFDGVCRCHEDWHGDDCSTKYVAGEKRQRRRRAPVPETDAQGAQTAGAAARKQGFLPAAKQEETTAAEDKALDQATKPPAPKPAPAATEDLADALNEEKKEVDAKEGKTDDAAETARLVAEVTSTDTSEKQAKAAPAAGDNDDKQKGPTREEKAEAAQEKLQQKQKDQQAQQAQQEKDQQEKDQQEKQQQQEEEAAPEQ